MFNSITKQRLLLASVLFFLFILAAGGLTARWYYARCNDPQHDEAWLMENLDSSIRQAYEYLYQSKGFYKPLNEGGEESIHHMLLDMALALEPHEGLSAQMAVARSKNESNLRWSIYHSLTTFGVPPDTEEATALMQSWIDESHGSFGAWFLAVAFPQRLTGFEPIHDRIFFNVDRLKSIYDMTHALVAYWFIKERNLPGNPSSETIERAKSAINSRLMPRQTWSPTVGDAYIEVAAVWLLAGDPLVRRRWIERIIESQSTDGGWVIAPSYWRRLQGILGLKMREETSAIHPTFLAVFTLTYYRELLKNTPLTD